VARAAPAAPLLTALQYSILCSIHPMQSWQLLLCGYQT